ncbi:MAG: TVP38/TMEM64 family protein [Caldimicrobium sp.]|nr:TVP38/TMEM64 family protein [Caldimicrobium sp.]MDW8183554.1 TVP38/TMEM64 family protein [Caldimicrobium sp.]
MWEEIVSLWEDRSLLRDLVRENPLLGAVLFTILQALQVVIAPLPGEVTGFMAGFLFGTIPGFLLSTTGILLGSMLAFLLVRTFRKHFLKRYEFHPYYVKIKRVFRKYGLTGVFILYLIPGFPKDILNYLVGFMPISFKSFIVVSTIGRAPGTLALAIQGDVVYGGHPLRIILVTSAFAVAFLSFLLLKKRLENYLNSNSTT